MAWLTRTLKSTIGRKWIVGLTGLALVGFLVGHMAGNLQIFLPSNQFNDYAHSLHGAWFFPVVEYGLIAVFLVHIALVIGLAIQNRKARGGQGYHTTATKQKKSLASRFWASKTMVASGLILIAFLVVHVLDFRLRHDEITNLQADVIGRLAEPWRAVLYIAGSLLAAWHMFHGFQSAFRSLGVVNKKWTPIIEKLGVGLSVLIGLGFTAIPVWILINF